MLRFLVMRILASDSRSPDHERHHLRDHPGAARRLWRLHPLDDDQPGPRHLRGGQRRRRAVPRAARPQRPDVRPVFPLDLGHGQPRRLRPQLLLQQARRRSGRRAPAAHHRAGAHLPHPRHDLRRHLRRAGGDPAIFLDRHHALLHLLPRHDRAALPAGADHPLYPRLQAERAGDRQLLLLQVRRRALVLGQVRRPREAHLAGGGDRDAGRARLQHAGDAGEPPRHAERPVYRDRPRQGPARKRGDLEARRAERAAPARRLPGRRAALHADRRGRGRHRLRPRHRRPGHRRLDEHRRRLRHRDAAPRPRRHAHRRQHHRRHPARRCSTRACGSRRAEPCPTPSTRSRRCPSDHLAEGTDTRTSTVGSTSQSFSALVWRRLRRSIPGMLGLVLVSILLFVSVFAYFFAPVDPKGAERRLRAPRQDQLLRPRPGLAPPPGGLPDRRDRRARPRHLPAADRPRLREPPPDGPLRARASPTRSSASRSTGTSSARSTARRSTSSAPTSSAATSSRAASSARRSRSRSHSSPSRSSPSSARSPASPRAISAAASTPGCNASSRSSSPSRSCRSTSR